MTVYIYISNYQCSIAVIKLQFRQFAALQQVPPGAARTPRTRLATPLPVRPN